MTKYSFATNAIRIGSKPDEINGSVIPGIFQTSTYVQPAPGKPKGYDYTRCKNPTRENLEECLASLEESKHCIATASGLSAITSVLNLFKQGANIICGNDVYGGVYRLLSTIFEDRYNIKWIDTTDISNIENACKEFGKVDLIWVEALSNPLLKITDISQTAQIAKKYGALLGVDSTFLTPYFQRPLQLGADIVVHSLTKYINGHSDVIAGGIFTNSDEIAEKLNYIQKTIGPALSPFDSWLVLRGTKTLSIRMKKHQENAKILAKFLESHNAIEKVLYGDSLKNFSVLRSQTINNFDGGGMISFYLKENANRFVERLKVIQLAESLGGVESLVCIPALMTHSSIPKAIREKNGITENLVRLSVGIEDIDDLIEDVSQALTF